MSVCIFGEHFLCLRVCIATFIASFLNVTVKIALKSVVEFDDKDIYYVYHKSHVHITDKDNLAYFLWLMVIL